MANHLSGTRRDIGCYCFDTNHTGGKWRTTPFLRITSLRFESALLWQNTCKPCLRATSVSELVLGTSFYPPADFKIIDRFQKCWWTCASCSRCTIMNRSWNSSGVQVKGTPNNKKYLKKVKTYFNCLCNYKVSTVQVEENPCCCSCQICQEEH